MANPSEISRDLVAIVESNDQLVWKGGTDERRVLVATWTDWEGYRQKVGQTMPLEQEVWVTTVPELKHFCKKERLPHTEKVLRLKQL